MSPLVKVALLVLAAVSCHIAANPPNSHPAKEDRVNKQTFFEKFPRLFGGIVQMVAMAFLVIESAILLVLYLQVPYSSAILSTVCGNPSPSLTNLSVLSPLLFLGIGMVHASTVGRLWCYRTLGTHFTYEITIKRDHKLITSGPYAIVRHPGYTMGMLLILGMNVIIFCPHGYFDECRLMSTPARWIVLGWFATLGYSALSMLRRGKIEDEGLRREFGASWESYRRSVPYKFVPWLI